MAEQTEPPWRIRDAKPSDASDLAVLIDIASRGMLTWLWRQMTANGQSPLEFGRERILVRKDLPSHFSNWQVAMHKEQSAGAMAGYTVPDPYDPGDIDGLPSQYQPLLELEAVAAGTWHLMALAVFPAFRNRGLGSEMLKRFEAKASTAEHPVVSIIANSANGGACRLYQRHGYSIREQRDYIPFPDSSDKGEWRLFQKAML